MSESHTTVNGQPAIGLKDTGDSAALYVSDSARPMILKVYDPGSGGGNMNFSNYGSTPALSYPPSSEVVDGSQYGL
jgi:hypothetical protein